MTQLALTVLAFLSVLAFGVTSLWFAMRATKQEAATGERAKAMATALEAERRASAELAKRVTLPDVVKDLRDGKF